MNSLKLLGAFGTKGRNIGTIIRKPEAGSGVKHPSTITRQLGNFCMSTDFTNSIERYARCSAEGISTESGYIGLILEDVCSRIDEFTSVEVRTIAHCLVSALDRGSIKEQWIHRLANFALKRCKLMPFCVLSPLLNSRLHDRTLEV